MCLLQESLAENGLKFQFKFRNRIHDREVRLDTGWVIKIGRGFDIYQKPENWYTIGTSDFELRPCLETKVDIFRQG
ncbi:MAG TPA: MIT C-terminal domain-containing protein [bacterium]|nr:MIT C-terminal domain-containing protein [bacterium]HPM99348.1 MIT C-terminal domain-containing protein [bacterium]